MNSALGLLVLSLLGTEGFPQQGTPEIAYTVRVLQMNGLDWRGAFFSQLHPVARQGGTTIWTVSNDTVQKLADRDPKGLRAPRVTAASQAVAHIFNRANRKVTSGLNRMADGPFDHATQVAYSPSYEEVREGWAITLSGRKIDQGVLACVVLDDTRIATVHQVALTEHLGAKNCCDGVEGCASDCKKLDTRIEVPEVAHAAATGEWLIPNDGALVVSLGAQTTADDQGKAVVVERLVLIEATGIGLDDVRQASLTIPASMSSHGSGKPPEIFSGDPTPPTIEPFKAAPQMTMPSMPSRSLPQARAVDGSPITLPPLPENPTTPSSLPGSSEPCASPQAPNRRNEASTLDSDSTKAGFDVTLSTKDKSKEKEAEPGNSPRPCLLRVPISAGGLNLDVEIRAVLPVLNLGKSRSPAQEK